MRKHVKVDKVLDVQGLPCPTPTVMTGKTLQGMKKGASLRVITNDMTTKDSIPSLCNREGYHLMEMEEDSGLFCFTIRK